MPLDALSGNVSAESLAISLEQRDIKPVDWNTLAAHKQAQLEKFGPSFWYQHQTSLGFTLIGSIGLMALTAGAANSLMQPSSPVLLWISVAWMCLLAALIVSGVLRVRAGSHWEEHWLPIDGLETWGVPEPIAAMARSMHRKVPGSTVILGELIRESVVLDPYLLLVHGEERVCLGLWDDTGIIASASSLG
ncbi:MAG: hypothetical protein QOD93_3837 [Acetobacteraceae bacterium]|jgi:hypothetical protein|nr:hypothetical protein [Acetobacteraceae bacterium]